MYFSPKISSTRRSIVCSGQNVIMTYFVMFELTDFESHCDSTTGSSGENSKNSFLRSLYPENSLSSLYYRMSEKYENLGPRMQFVIVRCVCQRIKMILREHRSSTRTNKELSKLNSLSRFIERWRETTTLLGGRRQHRRERVLLFVLFLPRKGHSVFQLNAFHAVVSFKLP